jgi:hypothetical protein
MKVRGGNASEDMSLVRLDMDAKNSRRPKHRLGNYYRRNKQDT